MEYKFCIIQTTLCISSLGLKLYVFYSVDFGAVAPEI